MRQQRCPTHNISLIDGVCLQCKKLEEGYNKNFRNPDIDIPAEAYDAAEQLENNKVEREKEDQEELWDEAFANAPVRIHPKTEEYLKSRYHITCK